MSSRQLYRMCYQVGKFLHLTYKQKVVMLSLINPSIQIYSLWVRHKTGKLIECHSSHFLSMQETQRDHHRTAIHNTSLPTHTILQIQHCEETPTHFIQIICTSRNFACMSQGNLTFYPGLTAKLPFTMFVNSTKYC